MKAGKGAAIALVLLVAAQAPVVAQRIVNACVINRIKVSEAYMRESRRARELDAFMENVEEEIARMTTEIELLKSRRLDAVRDNNDRRVDELDDQLREMEDNLSTYRELQQRKREQMIQDLIDTDAFYRDLIAAIQRVCEEEGFSLAYDLNVAGILWWDPEIDITQRVIRALSLR